MSAKKQLGQHFLVNEQVIQKIFLAIQDNIATLPIVEIGPGMGALTKYLIKLPQQITCVELDSRCIDYLKSYNQFNKINLIEADFLKLDFATTFSGEQAIVGNFPYNISSQIIFKAIENRIQVPVVVGMFQKEMADRVAAKHGSKTYGIISVLTQYYYDATLLFDIEPKNFAPPPKVMSSILLLKRKENLLPLKDEKLFTNIVKFGFNQRRKMLRSSLKAILPKSFLEDVFFNQRAEQLSVEDFVALANKAVDYV
ncbi:MAG: ribosomal RNA small subunit methyltransferase A [Chitinophagales bacterium]|nr:ribosomal RNA small subunit methyltransferase A [Chitinophagales bacterium]